MDFFAELDRITRAYTNPLTVAEKIRRDYAQMPEYVEPRAVEQYDEIAKRRARREQQREDDYNNSGRI